MINLLLHQGGTVHIAILFQLHPMKKEGLKSSDFFRVFSEFVDLLAKNKGHLLIFGDFNIHWDSPCDANTNIYLAF